MPLATLTLVVVADVMHPSIAASLDAIAATVVDLPFEVLIAANGIAIDQSIMTGRSFGATFVSSEGAIPPGLFLNSVLAHAKGDVVSIVPAGVTFERWWLRGVINLLERPEIGVVVPRLLDQSGTAVVSAGAIIDGGVFVNRYARMHRDATPVLEPAALVVMPIDGVSFRREILGHVGPFATDYERGLWDFDWAMRVRARQLAIAYRPDISMRTAIEPLTGRTIDERADAHRFLSSWGPALAPHLDVERFIS
jgi:hypothetical protein